MNDSLSISSEVPIPLTCPPAGGVSDVTILVHIALLIGLAWILRAAWRRWRWKNVGPLLVWLGVCCAGCAHRATPLRTIGIEMPDQWARASKKMPGTSPSNSDWWVELGDAALDAWLRAAVTQNFTIAKALARLEESRRAAEVAGADRWPAVNLEGSARRARAMMGASPLGARAISTANQFALGLAASYELDLWGRVAAQARAALAEVEASRFDLDTAVMTIAAETATAWFALKEQRALRNLLERQEQISKDYLRLVELRFSQGLASALDVYQQRQQLASVRALRPPVEAQIAVREHQLAVLAGCAPGQSVPMDERTWANPPPLPDLGLPCSLLRQRPDVAAAEYRLRAADERWAAAVANRLPTLRLSGAVQGQSQELADVLDEWFWNLTGNLVAPVFDAGRRRAQAQQADAVRAQAWWTWKQTFLDAVREVEDALARERAQRGLVERMEEQRIAAQRTLEQARRNWVNGLSDYLAVLTALNQLQQTERSLVSARAQWITERIRLHRALGGSWVRQLSDPVMAGTRGGT